MGSAHHDPCHGSGDSRAGAPAGSGPGRYLRRSSQPVSQSVRPSVSQLTRAEARPGRGWGWWQREAPAATCGWAARARGGPGASAGSPAPALGSARRPRAGRPEALPRAPRQDGPAAAGRVRSHAGGWRRREHWRGVGLGSATPCRRLLRAPLRCRVRREGPAAACSAAAFQQEAGTACWVKRRWNRPWEEMMEIADL